ncbi:hypothetical protein [Notoacmeibacter sp. MSK16QG-6]|nr:hypothetical protein [Notoacmeibacter sp. MSK16QG-6]MCP1200722.1 hypothetical protein [Notoacmeibacter sp. MSK16QG-6]
MLILMLALTMMIAMMIATLVTAHQESEKRRSVELRIRSTPFGKVRRI